MAHQHPCRHCENEFVCGENAAECFKRYIVCQKCFWTVELKYFVWVLVLAVLATGLTLFVADNY